MRLNLDNRLSKITLETYGFFLNKSKNGFVVNKIVNAKYEKSHSAMTAYTNDFALMKTLGARYLTEDWTPETSWDLKCHFNIGSRTLDQFIKDDQHIFTQNFAEDKNL